MEETAQLDTKWIIKDSCLVLSVGETNSPLVPSAKEIYEAEFGGVHEIQGYEVKPPSISVHGLSISKYPMILNIIIDVDEEKSLISKQPFEYRVIGRNGGVKVEITDPLLRQADHIIVNNTWYPFLKESMEEIRRILEAGEIKTGGTLTLRQYFYLIKNPSEIINIELPNPKKLERGNLKTIPSASEGIIPGFRGKLYSYQKIGYIWLKMIDDEGLGCILADEMGLGKTIQVICLIAKDIAESKSPSLIIAPATLLENWRREFMKFTPHIKLLVHRGSDRTAYHSKMTEADVIVSSYETVIRDLPLFKMISWNIIALDEAQAIKNPDALRTKGVKTIPRRVSIAVTGTPIENRLTDLWSIMDFVLPGLLGTKYDFEKRFDDELRSASLLEPQISPLILRRTIKQVASDLPERIDIPQPINLPPEQISAYENVRIETINEYGKGATLPALVRLRMFCTHPDLLTEKHDDPAKISPKYCRLMEILDEMVENGEHALIFTSFSKMIDIFLSDLPQRFRNIYVDWIDGRVPVIQRQQKVDKFNNCQKPAVLILNPKAAGTGLNLTSANHVIHYNLEWNPATEDQASARAYRRGQERPVTIHRLFYISTVEEIISERLERKRELADSAIIGTTGQETDYKDIIQALEITPLVEE